MRNDVPDGYKLRVCIKMDFKNKASEYSIDSTTKSLDSSGTSDTSSTSDLID